MRTAGKRPKALLARRMRPRDSRFVPSLTDRPPQSRRMPPRPVPPALPPASIQAACGDFQEPLLATPVCCRYKKNIFQPALAKNLSRHAPRHPSPCKSHTCPPTASLLSQQARPGGHSDIPARRSPCIFPVPAGRTDPPAPPPHPHDSSHNAGPPVPTAGLQQKNGPPPQHRSHRPNATDTKVGDLAGRGRPSCPKMPAARTLPSRRPEQKFSRGWGYGGRGAFSKRRPFPRNSPIFPSHDTGRTFPSLPGPAVPGPLPSRPGLGKDAANKRRWRD